MKGDQDPGEQRKRKGLGGSVVAILLIILVIFVGYNLYYLLTSG